MYGFICEDGSFEWWVRRKEKGKSKVVISQEEFVVYNGSKKLDWIREHDLDYVLSKYCQCPNVVKETAGRLKQDLRL